MDGLSVNPIVITSSGYMVMPLAAHRFPSTLEGLDSVIDIYNERKSKISEVYTFDFFKRASIACAYTYGDFLQWARVHAMAAKISTTQFDFIIDTIRFIKTGRRVMTLANWARAVKFEAKLQVTEQQHATRKAIVEIELAGLPNSPIPLWCSHEGGLDDLITATAIMFGGIQTR